MRNQRRILAGLALVLGATSGCGGGAPSVSSSNEKVKVRGTVTLKGKPLNQGKILFDPANINRRDAPAANLVIGKDGTFSGETLAGENSVSVTSPDIAKSADLSANRQVTTLNSGENTVNIEL